MPFGGTGKFQNHLLSLCSSSKWAPEGGPKRAQMGPEKGPNGAKMEPKLGRNRVEKRTKSTKSHSILPFAKEGVRKFSKISSKIL